MGCKQCKIPGAPEINVPGFENISQADLDDIAKQGKSLTAFVDRIATWIIDEMKKDAEELAKNAGHKVRSIKDLIEAGGKPEAEKGALKETDPKPIDIVKELQTAMTGLLDKLKFDEKFNEAWEKAVGSVESLKQLPPQVLPKVKEEALKMTKEKTTQTVAKTVVTSAIEKAVNAKKGTPAAATTGAVGAPGTAAGAKAGAAGARAVVRTWNIGDHVQAKWKGGSYYPGVISLKNADGTYFIAFDDGSTEEKEPVDDIIDREWAIGTAVETPYFGDDSYYYTSTIMAKNANGTYHVQYPEGDEEDVAVAKIRDPAAQ